MAAIACSLFSLMYVDDLALVPLCQLQALVDPLAELTRVHSVGVDASSIIRKIDEYIV